MSNNQRNMKTNNLILPDSSKENKKCLLWGGYGLGNTGDELTLSAALGYLSEQFGDNVKILTPSPGYTGFLFPDYDMIHYTSTKPTKVCKCLSHFWSRFLDKYVDEQLRKPENKEWIRAIKESDTIFLVGGGYLTDLFTIQKFLLPVQIAQLFNLDIVTAPLGIGPIKSRKSKILLSKAFKRASLKVRDQESFTICKNAGLSPSLEPDDGFRGVKNLNLHSVSESRTEKLIGINYFPQQGSSSSQTEWWKDLLIIFKQNHIRLEGFCFHIQTSADFEHTARLFAAVDLSLSMVNPPNYDYRAACGCLLRYDGVIASRFHAVVAANTFGIPVVGVANGTYYLPKMTSACESFPESLVADPETHSPAEVAQHLMERLG